MKVLHAALIAFLFVVVHSQYGYSTYPQQPVYQQAQPQAFGNPQTASLPPSSGAPSAINPFAMPEPNRESIFPQLNRLSNSQRNMVIGSRNAISGLANNVKGNSNQIQGTYNDILNGHLNIAQGTRNGIINGNRNILQGQDNIVSNSNRNFVFGKLNFVTQP